MIDYYDVCVNTARMIGKAKATKREIEPIAKRMFSYTGKQFEERQFDVAFTEFNRANGAKLFQPIYA